MGRTLLYLISLVILGGGEAEETGANGLFKSPGEKRKVREPFKPRNVCSGSITLKTANGNEHVVQTSELNVNFKPDSIELYGKWGQYTKLSHWEVCVQIAIDFT